MVDFWVTIYPGWHDSNPHCLYASSTPPATIPDGARLLRISAAIPKFGGSMLAHENIQAVSTDLDQPAPPT